MNNQNPNPIKEYYIAYFDILGYQAFFKETPEKIPELLNSIHSAITNTVNYVQSFNNFLLCIEAGMDIT